MKGNSSLVTLILVFGLWLASVIGCVSQGDSGASATTPQNTIDYNHGGKIHVQYIPTKNATNIYHYIHVKDANHQESPLRPDLTIGNQVIKGRHTFEISDLVSFSGRKPSTFPTNTSLSIIHGVRTRKEWHFSPKVKVTIGADSNSFEIPVYSQSELQKDDPSDIEFYEVLITKPTYEMYQMIANAKDVTVQIGTASFKLDTESVASYGDFVEYLTPGNSTTSPTVTPTRSPVAIQKSAPTSSFEGYGVTLAGYNEIKTSMTYSKVASILGEEGVEISSNDIAGYRTVMYQWKAKNGIGNMNAMFQNGRLIQKAQFGLQ